MSYFESYLDEDLLNEDYYNEDLLSEDLLENFDESFDEAAKRRRPSTRSIRPNVSSAVKQRSNFGKALSGRANDYATKSELKKSLDAISNQVNELKKTSLATNKTLVALDQKHTELAKLDVRKGDNQTKVLKNMQMMSMMGSLLNQPKLDVTKLKVVKATEVGKPDTIVQDGTAIVVDQTMSLLLPMMTTMGDSGSGKSDNSNMMLPLVLIMSQQGQNNGGNNNNTISKGIDSGINAATSGNCNTQLTESSDFQTIAAKIVNILSIVVGVVAVIMIIYGGFRYITSGGESGSVSGAKNTLIYAIVGLVIVALAQFIVHFVLDNISA